MTTVPTAASQQAGIANSKIGPSGAVFVPEISLRAAKKGRPRALSDALALRPKVDPARNSATVQGFR